MTAIPPIDRSQSPAALLRVAQLRLAKGDDITAGVFMRESLIQFLQHAVKFHGIPIRPQATTPGERVTRLFAAGIVGDLPYAKGKTGPQRMRRLFASQIEAAG